MPGHSLSGTFCSKVFQTVENARENFKAAIALHLAYYNFVKTHGSVRCTPAMEAGIEKSAWTVSDLVNAA